MKKKSSKQGKANSFPALRVNQWQEYWDEVTYKHNAPRRKPKPYFYVLSLPASILRSLSGVEHRKTDKRKQGKVDLNIQRNLDEKRVKEITAFVENGYPWSELPESRRQDQQFEDLRMPGWLPTAIVINIKESGDKRDSGVVASRDLVKFEKNGDNYRFVMPESFDQSGWKPAGSLPIEVIDGQHRLWAFDKHDAESFELPVVAFHGLDITWQAYLFYVINIKPKKINASLAYDLYPLLRTEDWLNKIEGHLIYRETRAQELTEIMWSHPKSSWNARINMLGTTGEGEPQVRQSSWVRSLATTMVKKGEGRRVSIGGLFGGDQSGSVPWTRTEQSAFLIFAWGELEKSIKKTDKKWASSLRKLNGAGDAAFSGKMSLLNTDQGVRGFLHVLNDLMMVQRIELGLDRFKSDTPIGDPKPDEISDVLALFSKHKKIAKFVKDITECLANFDWRTSDAPGLSEADTTIKKTFRGSGGYKEIRQRLLRLLNSHKGELSEASEKVMKILKYK